ncbi:MAG: GIY-YIG nuclease family protein [Armatimonadetes bacterium]|nr:GIY-YIG nuclease family protein [Armatimonadota bacterium]
MYYVYIIESLRHPGQHYVGFTAQRMELRLDRHNMGTTPATARYRPWRLVWVGAFVDKGLALAFESYLKSGSGRAFAARRLCPPKPEA